MIVRPGDDGSGGFDLLAQADGRLPDLEVRVVGDGPGAEPLIAELDIEGLPSELHGEWSLPESGPTRIRFEAPREALGAVDARVANTEQLSLVAPHVAQSRQFLSFQREAGERLVTGHVEGIRLVEVDETDDGIDARVETAGLGAPLEVHADIDGVGDDALLLAANSTVDPLPAEVAVHITGVSGDDDPLEVVYESSDSVDVDGHVELREAAAGRGAACGTTGTLCADLEVRHLPARIASRVATPAPGETRPELRIAVDHERRPGGARPDITTGVTFRRPDDSVPLVARAAALGIPEHLRFRAVEGADGTTELAEFNACDDADFDAGACRGEGDASIGALEFALRNFLERPAGLPLLDQPSDNFAAIVGRSQPDGTVAFEAAGRVVEVAEVAFVSADTLGIRTRVGGGRPFVTDIDLEGVEALGATGPVDIRGHVAIPRLPAEFDFCFRESGQPAAVSGLHPVTAPCEDPAPFGEGMPLTESPLTVAYTADGTIDATAEIEVLDHGPDAASVADDHRLAARVVATGIPDLARVHVATPDAGPLRVRYRSGAPSPEAPVPTIEIAATDADADLVCGDPRQLAVGDRVSCVQGRVVGLPSTADVVFDPDQPEDNLSVDTDARIDIEDLELSIVEGVTADDGQPATEALVVTDAQIIGLPRQLTGTLHVPGEDDGDDAPLAVRFAAEPPITRIEATVQNFVGADPLPDAAPAPRAGLPPVDDSYDTVTVLQDGDHLRARVDVTSLAAAGYRSYRSGHGEPPEVPEGEPEVDPEAVMTHVVDVGFGDVGRKMRAYADLDDGTEHVIADVALTDRPADLSLCFRGGRFAAEPVAQPTFCDTAEGQKAAFELTTVPGTGGAQLDVNAFFRILDRSTSEIIAGRADVEDLPPVLRGDLGEDGNIVIEALQGDGETSASVGRIDAHVATFDIADHGYAASEQPFVEQRVARPPFPAFVAPGQHLGLALDALDVEARLLVGPPTEGAPGSRLSRVRLAPVACDAPDGRTDYPHYPPDPPRSEDTGQPPQPPYTCARVDFEPATGAEDPLAMGIALVKGGTTLTLRDAELSDVPDWLQVTLADTATVDAESEGEPFLDSCGTVGAPAATPCMPPLLRFDTDAGQATVSGVLEVGTLTELETLAGAGRRLDDLPDLFALPTAEGWSDWDDPGGIRAVVGEVPATGDTIAHLGFRIGLPDSFTLDPPQQWSEERRRTGPDEHFEARDIGLHYAARRDGSVVDSLGRVALVKHDPDGGELVLTDGGERDSLHGVTGEDPRAPLGIPGELDIAVFLRDNKLLGRSLIQVDGRLNAPTDLRARMVPPPADLETPDLDVHLVNLPPPAAGADPEDPSFRIQAEIIGSPEPAQGDPPSSPNQCSRLGLAESSSCNLEVGVEHIFATFDLAADPDHPVRLLKAVARSEPGQGFQVQAFDRIEGTDEPSAVVSGGLGITLDPLNLTFRYNLLLLATKVDLRSSLDVFVALDRVSDFTFRAGGPHLLIQNRHHGSLDEGAGYLLPVIDLDHFDADITAVLPLFDVDVFGLRYLDFSDDPIDIKYEECGLGRGLLEGLVDAVSIPVLFLGQVLNLFGLEVREAQVLGVPAGDSSDVVILPAYELHAELADPRFFLDILEIPIPVPFAGGAVGLLYNVFDGLACNAPIEDMVLIGDDGPDGEVHPADTLARPGHPIPGIPVDPTAVPDPELEPTTLVVPAGETVRLCSVQRFAEVDIFGTLEETQEAGPNCPREGSILPPALVLEATRVTVHEGGVLAGPSRHRGDLGPSDPDRSWRVIADTITINGTVLSDMDQIQLHARNELVIGETGRVSANATDAVQHDPLGPPTGNSGGGHGGAGGEGSDGDRGEAFGDHDARSAATEPGDPGAGRRGGLEELLRDFGRGGGAILLHGDVVRVLGEVTANGANGEGDCTAGRGGGGGAGGGIVISGLEVRLHGTVTANGGHGGIGPEGSGGGGGGGVIKVLAPLVRGGLPPVPSGGEGGKDCETGDPAGDDADGRAGKSLHDPRPQSRIEPVDGFWLTEDEGPGTDEHNAAVTVVGASGGSGGAEVVVCGLWLPPDIVDTDGPPTPADYQPLMSPLFTVNRGDPCGTRVLNVTFPSREITRRSVSTGAIFSIDVPLGDMSAYCTSSDRDRLCPEGFWGLWTMVVPDSGLEAVPPQPDTVFGLDNTDPRVVLAEVLTQTEPPVVAHVDFDDRWFTSTEEFAFVLEADDLAEPTASSGVADVKCVEVDEIDGEEVRKPFDCELGRNDHTFLTEGDGFKTIEVTLTDRAGNQNRENDGSGLFLPPNNIWITYDITPPLGSPGLFAPHAEMVPGQPDGANGWYRSVPDITLLSPFDSDNSDGSPGSGEPSGAPDDPVWRYRFDETDERPCPQRFCAIPDVPTLGKHVLHFTAVDRVGNRLPAESDDPEAPVMFATDEFQVDAFAPISELFTVPTDPDGEGDWFVTDPFVVVAAVDQRDGSGLVTAEGEEPVAGRFVRVNGNPEERYDGPFRLGPGVHEVCWRAIDVAGNPDVGVVGVEPTLDELALAGHCREIQVDAAAPTVAVRAAPTAPDGGGGWYVTEPTVTVEADDPDPGAGLVGVFVAVDGGEYVPYSGPITLGEGEHAVRAFAVDGAGQRSTVEELVVRVDVSTPSIDARPIPRVPARDGWWRRPVDVVLRASDGAENSGVSSMTYRIDGGPVQPYGGPFTLGSGEHTVTFEATDIAGHTGSDTITVAVDDGPPLARATRPDPATWSRLLGPPTADLHWEVGDDRSATVRVSVLVIGPSGTVVRRLDAGVVSVQPGTVTAGSVAWDGRDQNGTQVFGTVHHRVVVIDEAGNRAQSSESRPLQIVLL
ncbi:MAG: hypothetical protein ACRD0G_16520 [Acidimicrobiales bacterium]